MLMKLVAVAAGGALGASLRYVIHLFWVTRAAFPLGTLSANVLGCVLIGGLMWCSIERDWLSGQAKLLVVTGLLGSLTTFSTFGFETLELLDQGRWAWVAANIAANLVLGLGGVWLGWVVAARVLGQ